MSNKPEWMKLLEEQLDKKKPAQVARELDVSQALISQVMSNTYKASTDKFSRRVMNIYGHGGKVPCPVKGRIEPLECAGTYKRAKKVGLNVGNQTTFRQNRACITCLLRKENGQS